MEPEVKIIVFYVLAGIGEMVYDSLDLKFVELRNFVSFDLLMSLQRIYGLVS